MAPQRRRRVALRVADPADREWVRARIAPLLGLVDPGVEDGDPGAQDDAAIHYHLRDIFTGEMYVRSGDELARRGFKVGLAPDELHVLEVEDILIEDIASVPSGVSSHSLRSPRAAAS